MREIKVGDEVVIIEVWPDSIGKLVPDQTTGDCRFYGVCVEVGDGEVFVVPPDETETETEPLTFPTSLDDVRQGDSVAFHIEEATKSFPISLTSNIET